MMEDMKMWFEIYMFQNCYIGYFDNDWFEYWLEMFIEDCMYEIVLKENVDFGLLVGIVYCMNQWMLCDCVVLLWYVNIYEEYMYWYMMLGLMIVVECDGEIDIESNYVVVQMCSNGELNVYQVGKYYDMVVCMFDGLCYKIKCVIYDMLCVQMLFVMLI